MPTLRTFFATVLLGLSLSVGPVYAGDPPSAEAVQLSLDKIADRKLPDADQKALQTVLEQTLSFLANKSDYEQRLIEVKDQLHSAPRQTIDNQRELARLKASKVVPIEQRYATLSVQQLEQMLADRTTEQGELQKALASANTQSIAAQTRPERAQAEISNSQTRIQQIGNILKVGRDNGKLLTGDQRNQLSAESAALTALIASGAGRQQPTARLERQPARLAAGKNHAPGPGNPGPADPDQQEASGPVATDSDRTID